MPKISENVDFIEQFSISKQRICLKIWDTSQMSLSWKTPIICCYSLFWKWKWGQIWIIWVIATIRNTLTKPISIKKSNILDYIIFRCTFVLQTFDEIKYDLGHNREKDIESIYLSQP